MAKEKTTTAKATEVKGEKNPETVTPSTEKVSLKDLTPEEFGAYRKMQRDACGAAIDKLLTEYQTDLTARVIVGADAVIPQVFLIDARPKAPIQE
tara:strand:- start:1440 stop:1724 length:285 start_codon:yes stop_codon:yes gene_type:complete